MEFIYGGLTPGFRKASYQDISLAIDQSKDE